MGLAFKKPKSDTCSKCDTYKIQIDIAQSEEDKAKIKKQQEKHHEAAEIAYKSKDADKIQAANSCSKIKIYTFDLQQCLPTPLLRSNISFYKRQLWTYNLTVHDCVSNKPYCYMWHEGLAKRGGNEIASCLLQHLLAEPSTTEHVVLYSDCCGGQNKNSLVASMFNIFLQSAENIKIIDHKFMLPGHTHMECDVDHSIIERKKKKTCVQIHHPREWYQFVRTAGTKKQFEVIEIEQNMFLDFGKAAKTKFMWRASDLDGNKFKWSDVKWLRYTNKFGKIQYKTSLKEEEPFKELNICRRGINIVKISDVNNCYESPQLISREKKQDLLDQLHLINEIYHNFYRQLNDGSVPNVDPDINFEEDGSDVDSEN